MKNVLKLVISAVILFTSAAHAECKWSEGIKKTDQGYLYTEACHGQVGILLKDSDDLKTQVDLLHKTIDIKDLVIAKADERTILWRNESYEQFDRLQKQTDASHKNETLYFILGVVVTGAAVWGAGQLR